MLIRAKELIKHIKVSESTLNSWREKRNMPHHIIGKSVFYDLDEVMKWIKNYKNPE